MPFVVFRCDANSQIGIGHVMRCLTLATEMREQGWKTLFVVEQGSSLICNSLNKSSHTFIEIENIAIEDVVAVVSEQGHNPVDLFVIDHYGIDRSFESILRRTGAKVMVIDDLCNRFHDCDLLLDQTFGRIAGDYRKYLPENCEILIGSAFTLLRKQFAEIRDKSIASRLSRVQNGLQNILLTFGGTDQSELIIRVLEGLNRCVQNFNVDVVLNSSVQMQKVESLLSGLHSLNCILHYDVDDMAGLMSRADLAIAAGGTTSWERCCLGLPTFLVLLAENQIKIAQNLEQAGAVLNLGWSEGVNAALIQKEIMRFTSERQSEMSERARLICDGKGCKTVVSYLNQLIV